MRWGTRHQAHQADLCRWAGPFHATVTATAWPTTTCHTHWTTAEGGRVNVPGEMHGLTKASHNEAHSCKKKNERLPGPAPLVCPSYPCYPCMSQAEKMFAKKKSLQTNATPPLAKLAKGRDTGETMPGKSRGGGGGYKKKKEKKRTY